MHNQMEGTGAMVISAKVREPRSRVQIFRHDAREKIFEVNDALSLTPDESKVQFVILEYTRGGGVGSSKQQVRHWMDASVAKAVCSAILEGRLESLAGVSAAQLKEAKPIELYSEMKGTNNESRILKIRLSPANDKPYQIAIVNGPGEVVGTGIVKPVSGARSADKVDLMVSFTRLELYKMAREVLDYIRDWEVVNFRKRQAARTITRLPPDMAA
jgi:hypothetical protein